MEKTRRAKWKDAIGSVSGFFLCVLLVIVAFTPLNLYLAQNLPLLLLPFALFGAVYFLLFRFSRGFVWPAHILYHGSLAVYLALVGWALMAVQPYIFPMAASVALLHFTIVKSTEKRWVSIPFFLLVFLVLAQIDRPEIRLWIAIGSGVFLLLALLGGLRQTPAGLVSSVMTTLVCAGWFASSFYIGFDPAETNRVAGQPGMRLLIDPASPEAPELLGDAAIFCAKSCDKQYLLVGNRSGLRQRRLTPPVLHQRVAAGRPGNEVVYDCENNAAWIGHQSPSLLETDESFNLRKVHPVPRRVLSSLRRSGGLLLAGDEMSGDVFVFDATTLAVKNTAHCFGNRALLRDPKTDRLFAASPFRLNRIEPQTGRFEQRIFFPSIALSVDSDEMGGDMFVATYSSGNLYRIESATGRVMNKVRLESGLGSVRFLPEYSLVAVGNYAKGKLNLVDAQSLAVVGTYDAGRRIGPLHMVPGDHELTFTSRAGVFALDIQKVLDAADAQKPLPGPPPAPPL